MWESWQREAALKTWLVIFRGDPVDGGTPIGVVNDLGVCLTAVRAAWAELQRAYRGAERQSDPVLLEGFRGMDQRLRAASQELAEQEPGHEFSPADKPIRPGATGRRKLGSGAPDSADMGEP
jgi:hypothetical protein